MSLKLAINTKVITNCNYRAIARLSGALLMNEELNFSKRLNEIMMNEMNEMEKNGMKKN